MSAKGIVNTFLTKNIIIIIIILLYPKHHEHFCQLSTESYEKQFHPNMQILFVADFQYMEGPKDQGINVREKAKQLVALLKDDERLRNERARALKAKERFAQSVSGFGSDGLDTVSTLNDVSFIASYLCS